MSGKSWRKRRNNRGQAESRYFATLFATELACGKSTTNRFGCRVQQPI